MLNRWQAHKGAACGEVAPIIMCLEVAQHCSTSSTPNDSEVSAPRRLRYRSTSGYAWFAISDGTSSLRSPLRHHIALLHNTRGGRRAYCHTPPTNRQGRASFGIYHSAYNRASGCRPSTEGKFSSCRTPVSGSVGGPWVTLRSPTAKSLRLSPSGSRLSGDMAAQSGCRRVRGVGRIAIRPSHITQTAQMPQKGKAQQAPKVLDHA